MALNPFESETKKSLDLLSNTNKRFFHFRLFDTKTFRHLSEKIFCIKLPCDFIAIFQGTTYMIECKSSKNPTSYNFDYIKEHQMDSLLRAERAGAKSYFLISNRSRARQFKCYAIRAGKLNTIIRTSDRKSIKWGRLQNESITIPRLSQAWDFKRIFNMF